MNQDLASKRNIVFPAQSSSRKGFTLIELAFVLVIVGLLLGLGAQLIPMLVTQNKLSDDRTRVKEAKTALIGYALATGRLPFASLRYQWIRDLKPIQWVSSLVHDRNYRRGCVSNHALLCR